MSAKPFISISIDRKSVDLPFIKQGQCNRNISLGTVAGGVVAFSPTVVSGFSGMTGIAAAVLFFITFLLHPVRSGMMGFVYT